jgi:hypothetical protein
MGGEVLGIIFQVSGDPDLIRADSDDLVMVVRRWKVIRRAFNDQVRDFSFW